MAIQPLLDWVREREAIRLRKEAGVPPPWTEDPILNTYRFCNVRRQDDRVSRWLLKNVLQRPDVNVYSDSFLLFTAFCRWNNWPPVIDAIMSAGLYPAEEIDWGAVSKVIKQFHKQGLKAWTGAYMINAKGADGRSKADFICKRVIKKGLGGALSEVKIGIEKFRVSRAGTWRILTAIPNWGSFMAGQVIDDWGWTLLLRDAVDTYTWAPQGPGSLRGLNRVLELPLRQRHKEEEWNQHLRMLREAIVAGALGMGYADLTLHDVQNCLCEFDKYARAKAGEGRPRSKYKPEAAYCP